MPRLNRVLVANRVAEPDTDRLRAALHASLGGAAEAAQAAAAAGAAHHEAVRQAA